MEEQEVGFETHLWPAEESECKSKTGTDQQGSQPLCLQAAGACLPQRAAAKHVSRPREDF